MITISHEVGCRVCMLRDGVRHVYHDMDDDGLEAYKANTEYKMMTKIEKWRANGKKTCMYCGSSNVEIWNVQVNDYPLYDFDFLSDRSTRMNEQILQVNIDKNGSELKFRVGGTQRFERSFLQFAYLDIIGLINDRPRADFIPQDKGNFFICLTGKYDYDTCETIVRVERYRNTGVTIDEVFKSIKPTAEQLEIGDAVRLFPKK